MGFLDFSALITKIADAAKKDGIQIFTVAFIAATQSATRSGTFIRQAPNVPDWTRSDGQPTFRLISS